VLSKILVDEGGSAAVGEKIALLGDGGAPAAEGKPEARQAKPEARQAKPEAAGPRPETRPARAEAHESKPQARGPRPIVPPRSEAPRPLGPRPPAPRPQRNAPPAPATHRAPGAPREELSKIRRTVARRMAESKPEVPHFYMTAEIEMSQCASLKTQLAAARSEVGVSYTHLLLRAVALALGEHPRINARYAAEDAVEFSEGVHLGIAVALDEGLIVPVLHDCQSKDVFSIALEARALVERVRAGKAEGGDLSGGTFTVSNLGMYPIEEFAAVINPPQAAVLAVGSLAERAVVRDGAVVARQTMRVTLSSDHRVIDGAEAAQFLQTLKQMLENPLRLVL
jgi:pyruvate dehydrogenase E2 component (dihydrolipoamide acetyltransferase)